MCNYCKILIVDDEFIMRQGIKHMIDWEQEGVKVIGEASNCQEALEIIEKEKHIILQQELEKTLTMIYIQNLLMI